MDLDPTVEATHLSVASIWVQPTVVNEVKYSSINQELYIADTCQALS